VAVGIQRASATSNTGSVEAELRADPKPLVILATQGGATVSQTFDFALFCSSTPPVSPTSTVGGPLSLLTSTYNCATGAITFNPSGGDGTTITYVAVGIQRASATSNTGIVEAELRADPKPLVILATQGGTTISQTFDFALFCASARVATENSGMGLQIRVLGNPTTSATVSVEIQGAMGQPLTVRILDIRGQQQSEKYIEQAGITEVLTVPLGHSAGVYLIDVRGRGEHQVGRIVKL
jgi:hypothetical protein